MNAVSFAQNSLIQRQRLHTKQELSAIPWLGLLEMENKEFVVPDVKVTQAAEGDVVCRVGRPVTYWFGVIEGCSK